MRTALLVSLALLAATAAAAAIEPANAATKPETILRRSADAYLNCQRWTAIVICSEVTKDAAGRTTSANYVVCSVEWDRKRDALWLVFRGGGKAQPLRAAVEVKGDVVRYKLKDKDWAREPRTREGMERVIGACAPELAVDGIGGLYGGGTVLYQLAFANPREFGPLKVTSTKDRTAETYYKLDRLTRLPDKAKKGFLDWDCYRVQVDDVHPFVFDIREDDGEISQVESELSADKGKTSFRVIQLGRFDGPAEDFDASRDPVFR